MRFRVIQKLLGMLLMLFSTTMLTPVAVSLAYFDGTAPAFIQGFLVTVLAGFLMWWPARFEDRDLRLRDGFLVVAGFWIVLGSFGSAPLLFSERPYLTFTDAVFESVSGLTTTGATVLSGLDSLAPAVLFYRQQLQWLGGMGIIVLAVAVLPMLGVGGMQLYRAEAPGPVKDNKLTPRITETAKSLWYIYLGMTVTCAGAYTVAGMSFFDAICHAFSTVAIGGFSTHDASIGHFSSPAIELVAVLFMFLAGINFSLHFMAWRNSSLSQYLADPECRAYTMILASIATVVIIYLLYSAEFSSLTGPIISGLFQVVSIGTTTGFTTAHFATWPGLLPTLLIFASFIGGCAGSTGGGMKVIRCLLLYKQGAREVRRLIHPSAELPVKVGRMAVPQRVVDAVWGFFAVYVAVFALMMMALLMSGLDQITAFSAVAATLNNLGPGLGDVAQGFASVNAVAKWVCIAAMLLGRLEIFTLLVLVSPTFWRH